MTRTLEQLKADLRNRDVSTPEKLAEWRASLTPKELQILRDGIFGWMAENAPRIAPIAGRYYDEKQTAKK